MRDHGGFEHNLQSLRVVDVLEERYAEFPGLNLTFETREGILKHCAVAKARTLGELGRRFLDKTQPSLEAQLANVADEIAYNNHDVDDGLRAGLITIEQLRDVRLFAEQYDAVARRYPSLPERRAIYETVRRMIGCVVTDLIEESARRIADAGVHSIEDVRRQRGPCVAYSDAVKEQTLELKRFLRANLYAHERVKRVTDSSVVVLKELFRAFLDDPALLPGQYRAKVGEVGSDTAARARVIADYVAGMTDRYALREYAQLTGKSPDRLP
jgi:dGTPase